MFCVGVVFCCVAVRSVWFTLLDLLVGVPYYGFGWVMIVCLLDLGWCVCYGL